MASLRPGGCRPTARLGKNQLRNSRPGSKNEIRLSRPQGVIQPISELYLPGPNSMSLRWYGQSTSFSRTLRTIKARDGG